MWGEEIRWIGGKDNRSTSDKNCLKITVSAIIFKKKRYLSRRGSFGGKMG